MTDVGEQLAVLGAQMEQMRADQKLMMRELKELRLGFTELRVRAEKSSGMSPKMSLMVVGGIITFATVVVEIGGNLIGKLLSHS